VRLGSRKKQPRTNHKRKKYNDQQQKEMDCDESYLTSNEKCSPSSGQNGQLVHWWLLVHSGPPWVMVQSYGHYEISQRSCVKTD
jgi:hypothetical protein